MAISWLAVLKSVPWSEVVSNAPVIAEGARKLWKKTRAKTAEPVEVIVPQSDAAAADDPLLARMDARIVALEQGLAEAQQQLQASSELVKQLAEQNAQLITRVSILRRRVLWGAAAVFALLIWLLLRSFTG
ncbi:hypothetical protein [Craterilacuibacter sp. RT1T]|uniref:hypothetical protein n=1 Tax=Craterilacuibacter sp. RT1T TaxID=2942211 RepID=UPI0020BFE17A|nr:hypothetical protein [Craterilacuibacter sp. RT1T]MCL6264244.1 hypothetical protein [Craterilacuibacter sp. RT1T]